MFAFGLYTWDWFDDEREQDLICALIQMGLLISVLFVLTTWVYSWWVGFSVWWIVVGFALDLSRWLQLFCDCEFL